MIRRLSLPLLVLAVAVASPARAQDRQWQDLSVAEVAADLVNAPREYRAVSFDETRLAARLLTAKATSTPIVLPLPDGKSIQAGAYESSVLDPTLQARYPQIKSYTLSGQGVSGRMSVTPHGVNALYFTSGGAVSILPSRIRSGRHAVYYTHDIEIPAGLDLDMSSSDVGPTNSLTAAPPQVGALLHTYRLAVAVTGELTQAAGGTVADGMAVVNAAVVKLNAIYERDLAVTFVVVENNDAIIFSDGAADPYDVTLTNGYDHFVPNRQVMDDYIGAANYDVGHVLGPFVGGGGAATGAVCLDHTSYEPTGAGKADAFSQHNLGDPFADLVFPHEMGHISGAPHAWVTIDGGNSFNSGGVEPDAGYSIMSYGHFLSGRRPAGEAFGLQFHALSIQQIDGYLRSGRGSTCGTATPTGNDVPVVSLAALSLTIPAGTPFALDGSATDGSGTPVTYSWEQMDPYGDGTGAVPLFRSFDPRPTSLRRFPDPLVDYFDETLPTGSETYTFRLTARDNAPGGGGVGAADVQVTTDDSVGPFVVTFASTPGQRLALGVPHTVTWDVAGTGSGPSGSATVNLRFSTDGGATFPYVLASGVPNDGSEEVTFPVASSEGRVMVEAAENVFFNASETFEVQAYPVAGVSPTSVSETLAPEGTASASVSVSNSASAGALDLEWTARVTNASLPAAAPSACTEADALAQEAVTNATGTMEPGGFVYGQSVTATCAGVLRSVGVRAFDGRFAGESWSGVLRVYAGTGLSGAILSEGTVSADNPAAAGLMALPLEAPVAVEAGETYTFTLEVTSGRTLLAYDNANPYAGGTMYGSGPTGGTATPIGGLDLAFRLAFGEPEGFLRLGAYAGAVSPGASAPLGLTLDATGYPVGTYTADLVLATNDPDQPAITMPVSMTVEAEPPPTGGTPFASVNGPGYLAQLGDGRVLVPEYGSDQFLVFNADGTGRAVFADGFSGPWVATPLADGTILLMGYNNGEVRHYTADGTRLADFPMVSAPWGATQLTDGRILISNAGGRIEAFDPDGTRLTDFATVGGLRGIIQLSDGRVLVSSHSSNAVKAFASDGTPMADFAAASQPNDVIQLSDGRVLVAETSNNRVLEFAADGTPLGVFAEDVTFPEGLAYLADGRVLIAEYGGGQVTAFNGPPPTTDPVFSITPTAVSAETGPSGSGTTDLAIQNGASAGSGDLEWSVRVANAQDPSGGAPADACTDGQSVQQTSGAIPAGEMLPGGRLYGQSVASPCAGVLSAVALSLVHPFDGPPYDGETWTGTLRVYEGTGMSGTVLSETTVSVTNPLSATSGRSVTLPLAAPVAVTAGQAYSFALVVTSGRTTLGFNQSNPYGGGVMFEADDASGANYRAYGSFDLGFEAVFGQPEGFLHPTLYSGTVAPGASAPLSLAYDATGYADGTYTADLVFTTNDPDRAQVTVPVTMTVVDTAPAAPIFVNAAAAGANDGTSWTDAFTHLQDALAIATSDDEIWVAGGTYHPTTGADRTASFTVTGAQDGLAIYGGFAGTETDLAQRDLTAGHETVLSGDLGTASSAADNSYTVVSFDGTTSHLTSATRLDGVTITGGNADTGTGPSGWGGGVYCNGAGAGSECSPTLVNLTVVDNDARFGGGLFFNASAGGTSSPTVANVQILGNTSLVDGGGGVYAWAFNLGTTRPTFTNVVFAGNTAATRGGGYFGDASDGGTAEAVFENATFSGNTAAQSGGGLYLAFRTSGSATASLDNSVVWGNAASAGSQFDTNAGTYAFASSLVEGGCAPGTCLSADPLFVDADGADDTAGTLDDDLRLLVGSPALGAGNAGLLPSDAADLDGDGDTAEALPLDLALASRVQDDGLDLGAYEGAVEPPVTGTTLFVDASATGAGDGSSWGDAFTSLPAALAAATGDDEIWIAGGTYTPGANRNSSLFINETKDGLKIYGGFAGTEAALSERDLSAGHVTVIDGDIGVAGNRADNTRRLFNLEARNGSITSSTTFDGLVLANAYGDASQYNTGGALFCNALGGHACSPTISNVTFLNNAVTVDGGAVYLRVTTTSTSAPAFSNVRFLGNAAGINGGAVYLYADGGFVSASAAPTFTNVVFSGNSAGRDGGAYFDIHTRGGTVTPTFSNVTFSQNQAVRLGGGVVTGGQPVVNASILWGNSAPASPEYQTVGAGAIAFTNSTVQGGCAPQTCGTSDPLFVDPDGTDDLAGTLDDDLRLYEGSPAAGQGADLGPPVPVPPPPSEPIYVDASATGTNDGSSWTDAFTDLQDALAAATGEGQIWIADGTYTPTAGANRRATFEFQGGKDGLQIYGGFAGTETSLADRDLTPGNETILSGDIGSPGNAADNAYSVVTVKDASGPVTAATRLDGLTIMGGNANGGGNARNGGGLYLQANTPGSEASPTISNVTFRDNAALGTGGGVFIEAASGATASPAFETVVFSSNAAGSGGALGFNGAREGWVSPTFHDVTFQQNTATADGGAVSADLRLGAISMPTFHDVRFVENRAGRKGGGLHLYVVGGWSTTTSVAPTFTTVTFERNEAVQRGGGAIIDATSRGPSVTSPTFVNVTFVENTSTTVGGLELLTRHDGSALEATITNALFASNVGTRSVGALSVIGGFTEVDLSSSTITENEGLRGGSAFHVQGSSLDVVNSVVWNNPSRQAPYSTATGGTAVTVTSSLIEGGCPAVNSTCTGTILDTNPFFADATLRLSNVSPALDAGDASLLPADLADLDDDGNTTEDVPQDLLGGDRQQGAGLDLGAIEGGAIGPQPLALNGAEGYRWLALPYANLPLGGRGPGFLTNMVTAGYNGADYNSRSVTPTVYLWNEPTGFYSPANERAVEPGQGMWVYVFEDDDFLTPGIQGGFPKTLEVQGGSVVTGDFDFGVTNTASAPDPGYNLIGNPYPEAIDWDHPSWTKTGVAPLIHVYDPSYNGGDYRTWDGTTGDLTDGIIPAGQAFDVRVSGPTPRLVVTEAAKTGSPGTIYGAAAQAKTNAPRAAVSRANAAEEVPSHLAFRLGGTVDGGERETHAFVTIREEGALGLDAYDGSRLAGSANGLRLYSLVPEGYEGAGDALAIGSVPSDLGGPVEIPLHAEALAGGSATAAEATLAWHAAALPEGWTATLLDRQTGESYDLGAEGQLRLDITEAHAVAVSDALPASAAKAAQQAARQTGDGRTLPTPPLPLPLRARADQARFTLTLSPDGTTTAKSSFELAFGDAFPNPARSVARIGVTLPSEGAVSVEVFDALGRRVAETTGAYAEGPHDVAVPIRGLAAGSYVVRVEAAGASVTRRLTIVR